MAVAEHNSSTPERAREYLQSEGLDADAIVTSGLRDITRLKQVINMKKSTQPRGLTPALILDADGTIRRSKSGKKFIDGPDDIELMPGIEERIWHYRNKGYIIIIASNQGGVAHGFKSVSDADKEMEVTMGLFNENPVHIYKQCYHMADGHVEPYCHRSLFRKPDIGMLAEAEVDAYKAGIIIDWDNSLFVGDRPEDEKCAANAGVAYSDINDFLKMELVS